MASEPSIIKVSVMVVATSTAHVNGPRVYPTEPGGRSPPQPFVLRFDPLEIPGAWPSGDRAPPRGASSVVVFKESNPEPSGPLADMIPLFKSVSYRLRIYPPWITGADGPLGSPP